MRPPAQLSGRVSIHDDARWQEVPPGGVELLRGAAGGNAHTLVADPGTCVWTGDIIDTDGLAIAVLDAMAPVYLLHREHGGTGIAAEHRNLPRGVQRELQLRPRTRLVAD